MWFYLTVILCAISALCVATEPADGGRPGAGSEPITVSAAISLSEVLQEIGTAYEKSGGAPVRFNFAGSNVLARQILNGAPVDVFISADEAQMDVVERAGAVAAGTRRALVANQLAVVSLPDRVEIVREAFPHAGPGIRRLAIGDPAAVPAGVYARRYLERQGLWTRYEGRIVPTRNVRAAVAAVENGAADAAIVYVTDARATRNALIALKLPREPAAPIIYPGAVMGGTDHREEAVRFLAFLQSDAASSVFVKHGFLLPSR